MLRKINRKVFQKNRLEEYEKILKYAKDNGYKLVSLIDWYNNYLNSQQKVMILRHDIDNDSSGAYSFYKVEKRLNARSSFYFRWKTMKNDIMWDMYNDGFEVSLHFETLASYAKKNNIRHESEITIDVLNKCRDILSKEIKRFKSTYFEIKTICSHGDKRNRLLHTSNHVLTNKEFLLQNNILFETYDKDIVSKFDAYISDSSIYSNFEWQHSGSPYNMINQNKQTICLLTHPIHWNQSLAKNIKMLFFVYFDNK